MATDLSLAFRTRPWRARLLALTAALLLPIGQHAVASRDLRDRSVIGNWKLVSVLDLATIASLDEAEAKTLLGKIVAIRATGVKVDQEVCAAPEFWAERVIPETHMQEKLHSSAERLRLPNPVTMVELGCTDVYVRNPGRLVLLWGGVMFDAVRIATGSRSKDKATGSGKNSAVPAASKRSAPKSGPGKAGTIGRAARSGAGFRKPSTTARKQATARARHGSRQAPMPRPKRQPSRHRP